jgi:hypothetical protein
VVAEAFCAAIESAPKPAEYLAVAYQQAHALYGALGRDPARSFKRPATRVLIVSVRDADDVEATVVTEGPVDYCKFLARHLTEYARSVGWTPTFLKMTDPAKEAIGVVDAAKETP